MERYESFEAIQPEAVEGEWDRLIAKLQEAGAKAAMREAFDASPEELSRAAVAAAQRQGA